ncbi:MAG: M23 family metallopeptidase [Anaerolineales bacterium]|nr:M23 family metallopeptidase [Anaerolineales bacterium]
MKAIRRNNTLRIGLSLLFVLALVGGYFAYRWYARSGERTTRLLTWLRDPEAHPEWAVQAGQRCGQAPFLMPSAGYIGYLWDDSFRPGHRHQGIDIFGGQEAGLTPIYAAASGYLTRLADWKSSLIIRIPNDPLRPGRQIWAYYTHLADRQGNSFIDPAFPPGITDVYIEAGTLLGYQGNYSGDPNNPTGVHLHFSIVLDDGQGRFLNELKIENTLDPSPYLGLQLNANASDGRVPICDESR